MSSDFLLAAQAPVLFVLHALVSTFAPDAYMDEPFHVNQTQKYCAGQLHEWDPKITTFPGLYVFAALPSWVGTAVGLSGAPAWCTLAYLRGLNLLPALATPYLLLVLIRRLHPNTSPSDALANAVLLSLAPTHFFYHFLYYTDSLATVSALALLAIVMPARAERPSPRARLAARVPPPRAPPSARTTLGAGVAGAACLSLRQTNAVWIAFALGCDLLEELDHSNALPASLPPAAALAALPAALAERGFAPLRATMRRQWPLAVLLVGFAAFVVANGAVVVGDRANHAPAPHLAQLLYLTAYAAAPFDLHALTVALRGTLRGVAAAAIAAPATAAAALAAALGAAHYTYCHPFLLADNRHLTFYVWRHVLGRHWAVRYALAPAYAFLGALLYPPIVRQFGAPRTLGLVACAALALVPSPLLELRYLTIPALLLRLHAPPLAGAARWGLAIATFALVDAALVAVFLWRPYTWADGSVARFML